MSGEQPIFRVFIRDAAYRRIGELTQWVSLELVLRFNDVGTWTLEAHADSVEARQLQKAGGIIVTREIGGTEEIVFSGFVWTEYGYTATTFRASGYSDDALLWTPARPSPHLAGPPFEADYDVRTGVASSIMRQVVDANIGPNAPPEWKIPAVAFNTPDPLLGTTITSRANLQPLLTLLAELAITPYAGGLGFYLRQSELEAGKLEFVVYAPQDKSADAKFSIDLGTAQDYEDVLEAPEATHVYVMGGDAFGHNRTIISVKDVDAEAEWGRRISTVIDQRDVSDVGELNQKAAEAIAGAVTRRQTAITPFDVPSLQYGTDYDLGTLVTIVTRMGETIDLVRQIRMSLDPERGPTIIPVVGQGDGSDEERTATIVRTIRNRVSSLERNWNVPPDSIDRSMMVPVMKPLIGEVSWLAHTTVPAGWLRANGQVVNRVTYADLFALIGTAWNTGGESNLDFRLPNLTDRSPIGAGNLYAVAGLYGATTASGPAHTHPGSHSHGTVAHTHAGASHTHPGSHSHGIGSHSHTVNIDHNHPSFSSGGANVDTVAIGRDEPGSGAEDHHHAVDVPALGTTNVTSSGSGGSTDSDSNAPAASFSGPTGAASPATESDSNVFAASYSGSVATLHPVAGLYPVIYAGV